MRVGTAFAPPQPRSLAFPASSPEARFLAASQRSLALALGGGLCVALIIGLVLSTRLVRPVRALTHAAQRIEQGDLEQSVPATSGDELGELARAFSAMSARLSEANRLRQQMTANVSHDLRTPLTAVLGTLEALSTGALPVTPERLATAHAEAQRLNRLIDELHTLALFDAGEFTVRLSRVDAGEVCSQAARLFEAEANTRGITLSVDVPSKTPLRVDHDRLVQVLSNLLSNALRHTPSGGSVTLSVRNVGAHVEMAVADTGEGIPASVLPFVFERTVRSDDARSEAGSGLGLSIVRSLVEAMDGTVDAMSTIGQGTTVTLVFRMWTPEP